MKLLIVIPSYNEELVIENTLLKLAAYAQQFLTDYDYQIIAADNKSTDKTKEKARQLLAKINRLAYLFIEQKGKGLAIKRTWQKYQDDFDFFVFMDADLATDLSALLPLISALAKENYDLAIGSRNLKDSKIQRSLWRRFFSFGYGLLAKLILGTKISDSTCGFKAVNKKVVQEIMPLVKNQTWFFDSELVFLAEKKGFKIKEIPVCWAEPRKLDKSKVNVLKVSSQYLKELLRLRFFND
ncbi:MAG: glycosyltransferase [Candidatus Parcubacteria bacterium]|nr:glycosyltransferase [Candidatus Parcubacteria bacterium]